MTDAPLLNIRSFNPRTRTGCDQKGGGKATAQGCFNPRTRTGCDVKHIYNDICEGVSIHAPARGATRGSRAWRSKSKFQSTHPHGVRLVLNFFNRLSMRFQSTHPHGVRQDLRVMLGNWCCFNPRTRTGCDLTMIGSIIGGAMFQSTHPHGVRPYTQQ